VWTAYVRHWNPDVRQPRDTRHGEEATVTFLEYAEAQGNTPLAHLMAWFPRHIRVKNVEELRKHVGAYGTPRARDILERGIKEYEIQSEPTKI
jgi:hypothetical protein